MRVRGARHRDGAVLVLESVGRLVGDRGTGGAGAEVGCITATLDHEAVDHAMEDGAVVVAGLDVSQEVLDRLRRLLRIEFENDFALIGFQGNLWIGSSWRCLYL